jgi:aspartate racemase
MTAALIADLQRGKTDHAAEGIHKVASLSFDQFGHQPVVCLACTELPLAFPELKALGIFEYRDILYINTSVLHANAAFEFAKGFED